MPNSSRPEEAYAIGSDVDAASEAKAAFALHLRASGVRDLATLRAFERLDRADFVPPHLAPAAMRDLALPIGCGQTMEAPSVAARMVQALQLEPHHRVLEIGTGTGYVTAALAQLAREVISVERYASLAHATSARLEACGVANVRVLHADGLAPAAELGAFDRIIAGGLLMEPLQGLLRRLALAGRMVWLSTRGEAQVIASMSLGQADPVTESIIACRIAPLVQGISVAL